MSIGKRVLVAAGIAAILAAVPMQTANAYWLRPAPGLGPWRHSYVHDPGYRWGPPALRSYVRDIHLYGPTYASWSQHRRYGSRWW